MKKTAIPVIFTIVLIILLGTAVIGKKMYSRYSYSKEHADLNSYFGVKDESDVPVILQNDPISQHAKLIDGDYYMDIDSVHTYLNNRFYEGKEDGTFIYTTPTAIITAKTGTGDWTSTDGSSQTEKYQIARYEGDILYVALDYVKKYTNFEYKTYTNPNHMQIYTKWDIRKTATISKNTELREKGGVKSDILEDLKKGDKVIILDEMNDWSKVKTADAFIGYVEKKRLMNRTDETPIGVSDYKTPEYTNITKPYKINMAWHVVAGKAGNDTLSSFMNNTKSVNTVSPTWFYINDNSGDITSYATSDYVAKAHDMGLEVWALVDNFSSKDIDSYQILSHAKSRANLISQLMEQASACGIDGINVDFENISQDCGESFIEFIRELSIACRTKQIVLSVDNYVPLSINDHYDRAEQGRVADYVVIMGYDEHYSGDKEAGSVASIDYVKNGIESTVKEVPSEKVINGIPFYSRIWTTSGGKVTSEAVGMAQAQEYISTHGIDMKWDDQTCQNYGEYTDKNGALMQIWLEDADSIEAKLGVMASNNLAGVAEWRLGFETADVWDKIAAYVGK